VIVVPITVTLTAVLSFNPGAFWEMTFRAAGDEDKKREEASA
jgi:paraquat-inducible protein A